MSDRQQMPMIKPTRRATKGNRKLLLLLLSFFIALLVVLFFQSTISKISKIEVTGNKYVSAEQVVQASGLAIEDRFFGVGKQMLRDRVKTLDIIESVKVSKHFPGRIMIEVQEYPEIAFQLQSDGKLSIIFSNGSTVPFVGNGVVVDKPILSGWTNEDPMKVKLCEVLALIPNHKTAEISEIRPDPSIAFPDRIKLYTRSKFIVTTTIDYLPGKLEYMSDYIFDLSKKDLNSRELIMMETDYNPSQIKEDGQGENNATQ